MRISGKGKKCLLGSFVRSRSGEVFRLILPTVNVELFSPALREFAKEVGAGENKRVLLVVDRAGWHTGGEVEVPEGIHLELLPSGSPELQPASALVTMRARSPDRKTCCS